MEKTKAKNEILNKYKAEKLDFICLIKRATAGVYISDLYKDGNIQLLDPQEPSVKIMTAIIEKCKLNQFGFYLFMDKNHNIYNCGSSGYFEEIQWCLKHENIQSFEKWILSSRLNHRPNTIEKVKVKITKRMVNILDKDLPISSHSSTNVKKSRKL